MLPLPLFRNSAQNSIPETALPPSTAWGALTAALAAFLVEMLLPTNQDWTTDLITVVRRVLLLLAPLDDVTGLALARGEIAFDEKHVGLALACELAGQFIETGDEISQEFLVSLSQALRSPSAAEKYPQLHLPAPGNKNPLIAFHNQMALFSTYPVFARALHEGLVDAWKVYGWDLKKTGSLSSLITAARRILPELDKSRVENLLASANEEELSEWIRSIAHSLMYANAASKPLPDETREQYFRDFCTLIGKEVWIGEDRKTGHGSGRRTRADWDNEDDDLPESDDAPDGLSEEQFKRIAAKVKKELHDDHPLDGDEDSDEQDPKRQFIYSDERAVMQEYLSKLAWHCTHPAELAWLVAKLCGYSLDIHSETRTLLLSVIFLGRSLEWLHSIRLGTKFETETRLEHPIYLPQLDAICFPPELVKSYPVKPLRTSDLFLPVSRNWILPVPAILAQNWRTLGENKAEGKALFTEDSFTAKENLKGLTRLYQKDFPNAPAFTEGRLRKAFTVMMVETGLKDEPKSESETHLNEVLLAMVSGQWRNSLHVPLFYSTLPMKELAVRFRKCSTEMVIRLRKFDIGVSSIPSRFEFRPTPDFYQGSPYHPKMEVLQSLVHGLCIFISNQSTDEGRKNAVTLAALYGLSLFCGLRISEAASARAILFDLLATWNKEPFPLLTLPQTKGNRFTFSARIVPIPRPIVPLLSQSLPASCDSQTPAFQIFSDGKHYQASTDWIAKLRQQAGLPLLRWHAARQNLNSGLFLTTRGIDTANAILGHQSAGREQFNPYLPDHLIETWKEYLDYADRSAIELGWQEVLNAAQ
jgi:hypothetical protein